MSEPGWHSSTQTLRYSDNDMIGHVNNAIYATMFEAGRTEMLEEAGGFEREGRLAPVIVRLEIDFRREMSWPGVVVVESAVVRFGAKSMRIRQRTLINGALTSEGLSILAFIDRETRRAAPLDADIRERFARWTLPEV